MRGVTTAAPQAPSDARWRGTAASVARGAEVVLEGVSKSFGRICAVRDVDLRVAAGEFLVVTGHSGSGKSTLLNLIGGLETPDRGRVLIDGQQLWLRQHQPRHRRELVGFVFQHHLLLSELSAQANVEVPLIGAGVGRTARAARARRLLEEVGLADRIEHRPAQLSGGERLRVAVARALVNQPRLLLADEPTGALDSTSSERLLDLLVRARDRRGMTMIVVSYDPLAGDRSDRTVTMRDGRIEHVREPLAQALA
jgi:ABC-type lipoprotein export system ATPase subunit